MYIPRYHALTDVDAMHHHIDQHPLGAWVCGSDNELTANHIPFFLERHSGQPARLVGHVSRANPVWRQLNEGVPSVVMFIGPQAYITPSWYPGKRAHGKVVPTWNYVAVHVHGVARAVEDSAWIMEMLNRLTDARESARADPWQVGDVPRDHLQKMLRAIVGIEIVIGHMEGRLKVSQDEEPADRHATVEGLMRESDSQGQAIASLVQRELRRDQDDDR